MKFGVVRTDPKKKPVIVMKIEEKITTGFTKYNIIGKIKTNCRAKKRKGNKGDKKSLQNYH